MTSPGDRAVRLCLLAVAAAGLAAYLNSFAGVFVFDDLEHIVEGGRARSWAAVWGIRPLTTATLALNYSLGGLDPWGYHAFNVVVHVLAGLTLFGLVRRVMLRLGTERHAMWTALTVAGIWVVHPLQTQGVTYVVQRGETLMALFYLLTLYCFVRGRYAAAIAACAAGMVSKEVMVTAPLAVLLLDYTLGDGSPWRDRWRLYAGLAATWVLLATTGAFSLLDPTPDGHVSAGFGVSDHGWFEYACTQPQVILHYLKLAVWPQTLCLDYAWPIERNPLVIVVSTLAVAAMAGLAVIAWWRRHPLGFPAVAFFLVLAPTSSVIPISDLAVEHRMYLPLASVVVIAVAGVATLLRRFELRPVFSAAVAGLVVAALGARTIVRNTDYRSAATMWTSVLHQAPHNPRACTELGNILLARGAHDEAIELYGQALLRHPEAHVALVNLGTALLRAGRPDEALHPCRRALELRPDAPETHHVLGNVLVAAGSHAEGITHLREAVRLGPRYSWHHCDLGRSLLLTADGVEGYAELVEAIRLDPWNHAAIGYLANAAEQRGDIDATLGPFAGVRGVARAHGLAWVLRADKLDKTGHIDEAINACERSLASDPGNELARALLDSLSRRSVTAVPVQ